MMNTIKEILETSKEKDSRTKDFSVNSKHLGYSAESQLTHGITSYGFTEWGKSQMCHKLGVPYSYIEKCPGSLQAVNLNHWLNHSDSNWLIRLIEENGTRYVRSVLTDKYSIFDNSEVLEMIDNAASDHKHEVKHFHMDDGFDGFNMRLIFPETSYDAGMTKTGRPDVLSFGLHIANSEVGKRSISISPMIYRLVCTNGLMVVADKGERFYQRHIGVRPEEMPEKVAEAFVRAIAQGNDQMQKFVATKGQTVTDPLKSIDDIARKMKKIYLPKDFAEVTKQCLQVERIEDSRASVYDLVNSFTRAAQNLKEDDRVAVETFIYRELIAA